jgi:S-adenosylmethionine synthetase
MRFVVASVETPLPNDRLVEIVERKGLGHPDSICDALAEAFSLELSRYYLAHTGRILHHNVDKVLLAAGRAQPRFGGGVLDDPMRIFLAGRATFECEGLTVPIAELAEHSAREWLARHLRALDVDRHVEVSSLVQPGSSELVSLYGKREGGGPALANDTSCGVGYAPLSDVERLVLEIEHHLNSDGVHGAESALGEDVKVMAVRHGDALELTVACAMIDRSLRDLTDYAKARERVAALTLEATQRVTALPVTIHVNAADDLDTGQIYLTVTGTSAEAGDDGQAGRGNRANGLITPGRAMTIQSVAGKNPVTHVGKLYNVAASSIAERLVASLDGVRGAECRLVSQIGQPIDEPQLAEVQLAGVDAERDRGLQQEAERIVLDELAHLPQLTEELVRGDVRIDRWPMRA